MARLIPPPVPNTPFLPDDDDALIGFYGTIGSEKKSAKGWGMKAAGFNALRDIMAAHMAATDRPQYAKLLTGSSGQNKIR